MYLNPLPIRIWVRDHVSNLKYSVMVYLASSHNVLHPLEVKYSTWDNGTVDRFCREVSLATRSIISGKKCAHHNWTHAIRMIHTALKFAP